MKRPAYIPAHRWDHMFIPARWEVQLCDCGLWRTHSTHITKLGAILSFIFKGI